MAGWFFIPLGQSALYVHIVHALLVFYVLALTPLFGQLQGVWLTVLLLGLMLVICVMVKKLFLFAIIPALETKEGPVAGPSVPCAPYARPARPNPHLSSPGNKF
ncbi:MAG: hypothetical protein PVS3B2_03280 [Candidatus Dormibacteraceae bacterium]